MYQFTDYYSILKIPPESTIAEVESAFIKEAREWQPNLHSAVNERKVMQNLVEARRILLNPVLRASYNREYYFHSGEDKLSIIIESETVGKNIEWLSEIVNKQQLQEIQSRVFAHKQYESAVVTSSKFDNEYRHDNNNNRIHVSSLNRSNVVSAPKLETEVLEMFVKVCDSTFVKKYGWIFIAYLILYRIKQ